MIRLPHLETNVTAACQNRCVGCNHFVPLMVPHVKASMIAPAQMERDLTYFARVAHVGRYGMLGGEPTLHPLLPALVEIARGSGVADGIEVWTNGQRLREMSPTFWRVMHGETLVVSVYPGKLTDDDVLWIRRACADAGVALEVKDERAFPNFTQLLKPAAARARETYDACWFKSFSRVLDHGYFYRCCTSPYIPKLLLGLPEGTDGLRVDASLTADALQAFLDQTTPMASCGICAGRNTPDAVPLPWREVDEPAEWLAASAGVTRSEGVAAQ